MSVARVVLCALLWFCGATTSLAQEVAREVRAHRANYSARSSRAIRRVVIHTSEGSEESAISWFRSPRSRVSAHYVVSFAGRVTRVVPDMSVAYHARRYNADSIGIEAEGYAARDGWTAAQYRALAALVRGLCERYGIPKDRRSIIGHSEVPNSGKVDPGRFFDWARFMSLVRGGPEAATPPVAVGLATVVANAVATKTLVEVVADGVAVHASPGGQPLGRLDRGTRFVATASTSAWTPITWAGRQAWVSTAGVRGVPGEVEVVTAQALNVRAGPSTSAGVIGLTGHDQAYHRLARQGPWALIQFDHRRAWVHTNYTRGGTLP
jgi:N-acetyl-anhydromuramyl-L-alanine amidase AmpD